MFWRKKQKVYQADHCTAIRQAIATYPLYSPPYRQGPNYARSDAPHGILTKEFCAAFAALSDAKFSFFLKHKFERLGIFREFMSSMGVVASLDEEGLKAVSIWCPGNAACIVGNARASDLQQVFFTLNKAWDGDMRGLNFIFDFGIFIGESLIALSPKLAWKFRKGASDNGEAYQTGFQIAGFRSASVHFDPMSTALDRCDAAQSAQLRGITSGLASPLALYNVVKAYSKR